MNDCKDKYVPCLLKTLRNARVKYVACGEEFSVFLTMVIMLILLWFVKLT